MGLLLVPALVNGFPYVFSDSGSYLASGYTGRPPLDGTILYGWWLRLCAMHISLWFPVIAQTALLAVLIVETHRRLSPGRTLRSSLVLAGVLAFGTTAPFLATLVLPDVFLPIGLLAAGLLLVGPSRRWHSWSLGVLVVLASATALSTLCVLTVAICVGVYVRRGAGRARAAAYLGLPALGWILTLSLNAMAGVSLPARGVSGYLLSTLAESGELHRVESERCPDPDLILCGVGTRAMDADQFLWSPSSPFQKLGGWGAVGAQRSILERYFRSASNWPHWLGKTASRAGSSLFSAGLDRDIYGPHGRGSAIAAALRTRLPRDEGRLLQARQQTLPGRDLGGRGALQLLLCVVAIGALAWAWRKRLIPHEAALFAAVVGGGVAGAALVSAALGIPNGSRSGARVAWLLPLTALVIVSRPKGVWSSLRAAWQWRIRPGPLAIRLVPILRRFQDVLGRGRVLSATAPLFFVILSAKLLWLHALLPTAWAVHSPFGYLRAALVGLLVDHTWAPLLGSLYWVTLGSVLVVVGAFAILPRRTFFYSLFAFDVFVSLLGWGDLVYNRYFHDLLSLPVIWEAFELRSIGGSVWALTKVVDLTLFVDLPLLLLLWRYRLRRTPEWASATPLRKRAAHSLAITAAGALLFSAPIAYHWKVIRPLIKAPWWSIHLYNEIGWIAFHTQSVERSIAQWMQVRHLTGQEKKAAEAWWHRRREEVDKPTPLFGAGKGMNLIVIQTEAFQDYAMGLTVKGVPVTPNLDALAKESLFFPNYFHQTGDGRTSDGEFISQCSMLGLKQGSVYVRFPNNDYPCLPNALRKEGYRTLAVHAFEPSFWSRYLVYPRMGFDQFVSKLDLEPGEQVGLGLGDADVFRQTVARVKALPKPFYAFIVTLSSHHPYNLGPKFHVLDTDGFEEPIFGDYLQAVHYVDGAMGVLVQSLKDNGLWDNTVVAIYGDHDNGVPDRGDYDRLLGKLPTAEYLQLRRRVGLILHVPGSSLAGDYPRPAGQQDLAPSLLHLLGFSTDSIFPLGKDVLSAEPHLLPFSDTSFIKGDLYFERWGRSGTCFDRKTNRKLKSSVCSALAEEAVSRIARSRQMILGNQMQALEPQAGLQAGAEGGAD